MDTIQKMPRPGARMMQIVSFVRKGSRVADIGTDHAYLPIYLIKSGVSVFAVAADVNERPLAGARRNIERAGVADRVCIRRSDGLSAVPAGEAEDIVIAGMGGELIIRIIGDCGYIKDPRYRLILSPNTKAATLRAWLYGQGFAIERERAALEGGKLYTVMQAAYTGSQYSDDFERYTGKLLDSPGEAERRYLQKELTRLQKRAYGYVKTGKRQEAGRILEIHRRIEQAMQEG